MKNKHLKHINCSYIYRSNLYDPCEPLHSKNSPVDNENFVNTVQLITVSHTQ